MYWLYFSIGGLLGLILMGAGLTWLIRWLDAKFGGMPEILALLLLSIVGAISALDLGLRGTMVFWIYTALSVPAYFVIRMIIYTEHDAQHPTDTHRRRFPWKKTIGYLLCIPSGLIGATALFYAFTSIGRPYASPEFAFFFGACCLVISFFSYVKLAR